MNKPENIIEYPDVGVVRYVQNNRARNLAIRINQQGEVRVTIPRYTNLKKAESFLWSKRHWIMRKLRELRERSGSALVLKEGDLLNVRGKSIPIALKYGAEPLEEALWRILLEEAREYLPGRVAALAKMHGFQFSGVRVRRMKTRWGSCTAKNSINLNSWLVMLPDHLLDYVILHELVHTRHRDHSARFWESLDRLTGDLSKSLRKELRGRQIMSIHPE
jgi:predicted metal-dependent hydrolase